MGLTVLSVKRCREHRQTPDLDFLVHFGTLVTEGGVGDPSIKERNRDCDNNHGSGLFGKWDNPYGEGRMFETLEPAEQPVARRWPLLMYGTYCFAGIVFVILGVRRHGLSEPAHLALSSVMFFLSLMWFITTLKSGTPVTNRKYGFRTMILLLLLMALQSLSLLR